MNAPAFLGRWFLRVALTLFVVFAANTLLYSEALAAIASLALPATLGFFVGGGFAAAGNWRALLLVLCPWATLLAVAGMSLRSY